MTVQELRSLPARAATCQGVIFAENVVTGEAMRDELALTGWLVVSPRCINRLRGRIIEPRLIIVGGASPYTFRDELMAALGPVPALYWITGGAL